MTRGEQRRPLQLLPKDGRNCRSLGFAPDDRKKHVEYCGIPLKPKPGLTPISCHAVLERSARAPFVKERRIKCINATSLHRKSGQWGTQPSLLAQFSDSIWHR